jgi:hypothetical protein
MQKYLINYPFPMFTKTVKTYLITISQNLLLFWNRQLILLILFRHLFTMHFISILAESVITLWKALFLPCFYKNGRTTYTYDNIDFRLLPGVVRDSEEWISLYKVRPVIEQTINHLKTNMCVADRKSRNLSTTKADLLLACISQVFTVIVADRIKNPKLLRSLKPFIA